MLWLMYFATSTGEASAMTDKAIRELKTEDPKYAAAPFMRINIDLEGNQSQKYHPSPCIRFGPSCARFNGHGLFREDLRKRGRKDIRS